MRESQERALWTVVSQFRKRQDDNWFSLSFADFARSTTSGCSEGSNNLESEMLEAKVKFAAFVREEGLNYDAAKGESGWWIDSIVFIELLRYAAWLHAAFKFIADYF